MTLDFYKRVLKRMVSNQEALIKNKMLTDEERAIEVGILSGVEICLKKAELIDEI